MPRSKGETGDARLPGLRFGDDVTTRPPFVRKKVPTPLPRLMMCNGQRDNYTKPSLTQSAAELPRR